MNLKALRGAATLSFSVALAGVMFAQGTSSGQQPTPAPGQRSGMQGMDGQTVTVTGCLVRASDLRGGAGAAAGTTPGGTTAGTAGSSGSDYVLSNVQMRSTSPGGASGTTAGGTTGGTTGGGTTAGAAEAPSSGRGMNLRLEAGSDTKLTEHVNQQVEVTGRLSMSGAGNRGGAGTTGGTTTGTTGTGTTGTGTTGTGTTGTGTTGSGAGTTGAGSTASAAGQGANNMGQLEVQTIRATGQSCKAGA
jgi:hypothetical protein